MPSWKDHEAIKWYLNKAQNLQPIEDLPVYIQPSQEDDSGHNEKTYVIVTKDERICRHRDEGDVCGLVFNPEGLKKHLKTAHHLQPFYSNRGKGGTPGKQVQQGWINWYIDVRNRHEATQPKTTSTLTPNLQQAPSQPVVNAIPSAPSAIDRVAFVSNAAYRAKFPEILDRFPNYSFEGVMIIVKATVDQQNANGV